MFRLSLTDVDHLDWDEIRRVCAVERTTIAVPHGASEIRWAQYRPFRHRSRLPAMGDPVLYRHQPWADPVLSQVIAVQPLDDLDDPNIWRVELDPFGDPILIEGRPVFMQGFDPWPMVTLSTKYGIGKTGEARLRGSQGWLPLDFATKWRPVSGLLLGLGEG